MSLLDLFRSLTGRLLSPGLPQGRFATMPDDGFMRVVGESHYQEVLSQLAPRCVPGAEDRASFPVALIPEPENVYDEHAIAVVSALGHVGYLPREDARRYAPTMKTLLADGYDGGKCSALLNGGSAGRPSYGVTLRLSYPRECEHHFNVIDATGKPTVGHVRGRHYTDHAPEVKQLRRDGDDERAEALLLELVDATEREAELFERSVGYWYYEQLAIIYRSRRDRDAEVAILERYATHPHGGASAKLRERLEKARQLGS